MIVHPGDTISIFSGLGGLDLGARLAGLQVAAAFDRDAAALELLHSALHTPTHTVDFEDRDATDALADAATGTTARFVIGGPPCTAFSHAGFWLAHKREGHDPAATRIDDYIEVVRRLRPDAFVLENVPGLLFRTHTKFFTSLIRRARRAGYAVTWRVLNSETFGVPQARRRLFVVGVRGGPPFTFPETASVARSSGWAIGDLLNATGAAEPDEVPGGRWGELLPHIPPGGNYLFFTEERGHAEPLFRYRGRYWSFLLKLDPERASPTVPAQRVTFNGPFHWANRHLRLREMARLQGFPDWFPLADDRAIARRHIGNAVPPLLGATVLWHLRRHLGDVDKSDLPEILEVAQDPASTIQDVMAAMALPAKTFQEAA